MWTWNPEINDVKWRRLLVAALAAMLLLGAIATYSLLANRHQSDGTRGAGDEPTAPPTPSAEAQTNVSLRASDAETFAQGVAEVLFDWDTQEMTTPTSTTELLVAVADPTGESSAGLVADIANYLPTEEIWPRLRKYETRQWIEVTSIEVPDQWAIALQQAGDELAPGTVALTVRGVRHRSGVWEGEGVTSEHDVAFTVFAVCAPTYPECHLLRLSRLDDPLE
ncbi:hypothetical protein GCM10011376_25690 [Nocardioides flavus (ex Wang et al. 2016)]|uniref:Uncharacterized protein n=1 Tax=Nocardioides flavus (ex Wang et al. 2016) TaxID=2058780 RepID=A0ABQ3HP79_9ACTN|nr:hypothetical protein [Nocardioides flavus (ex Wang et al. 2016)]GHE17959.1 hypothetical protein GCM10011376_25690 [Nocardioides flavus (ex Wang et al. 2016)]